MNLQWLLAALHTMLPWVVSGLLHAVRSELHTVRSYKVLIGITMRLAGAEGRVRGLSQQEPELPTA